MSIPRLLQIIRDEGSQKGQSIYLGEISSISPLKVKTNNIELDSDQLKITNYLVDVEIKDHVLSMADGYVTNVNKHEVEKKYLKDILVTGDVVLLIPVGGHFIIVGKLEGV